MNPAIKNLKEYWANLNQASEFNSIEEKVNHTWLMNQINSEIKNIKLCEMYGIPSNFLIDVLPATENNNFSYQVAHENESSNPCNWEEVKFNNEQVLLSGGDLCY